ncbi:MAG: MBL fold metallo-hydrolase [Bdellovibrionota bacterium]
MRCLIFFLSVFLASGSALAKLRVTVFDAGEGLSVLLEKNARAILIDTGPLQLTPRILDKMKRKKLSSLDHLILTHLHADHASGYFRVIESFPKVSVLENCHPIDVKTPGAVEQIVRWEFNALSQNPRRRCLKAGDELAWQGAKLKVLWPEKIEGTDLNKNSLVLLVEEGQSRTLVMGDATQDVERELLGQGRAPQQVDILVVGHHGANDTSDDAFLARVRPKVSIVPVDQNNYWGRPAERVLKLLEKYSGRVMITGKEGDICHSLGASIKDRQVRACAP